LMRFDEQFDAFAPALRVNLLNLVEIRI